MTATFYGRIEGGRIQLHNPSAWTAQIMRLDGKEIELALCKRRQKRSLEANAYFHSVVLPALAEAAGYEDLQMKDALKAHFLSVHDGNGKLPRVRGTSELNTAEFADFVDRCIRLGAEMYRIVIPDPSGGMLHGI